MRNETKRRKMTKTMAALLAVCFTAALSGPAASTRSPLGAATAQAQEYFSDRRFSQEQLDNLLAPIALYPDPLLAQVLVAGTFVDQVEDAARWMRAYNDPYAIDDQPWDLSVKAVAHYPSVLYMMSDRIDWTTALGQAYVNQSTDVMASVQHLRAMAYSAGNLISNQQQQVIAEKDYIEIVPYQPEVIYVPAYDPGIIYAEPAYFGGFYPATIITFGPAFPIGAWLNRDCDWGRRRIYYHGWRGGGWIARSRPHVHITNVYVNNYYTNIQINRNVVRRDVNYNNLNRYTSVHREVNYNNLARGNRGSPDNPNAGNRIIRRDVDNPRRDTDRGRPPVEQRAREDKSPRTREEGLPQAREDRSPRTREERPPRSPSPQVARPAPEPPPRDLQQPPRSAPSGNRNFDPRANREREQTIRAREQPAPSPAANAPRPPAGKSRGDRREAEG